MTCRSAAPESRAEAAITNSGPRELSLLVQQHYALRRIATTVARGARPAEVFSMVSDELARCLNVDTAAMFRFETDGTVALPGAEQRVLSGAHPQFIHRREGVTEIGTLSMRSL